MLELDTIALNDFKELKIDFAMVNESDILNLIQESKKSQKDRKFKQALELYIVFKDIDVKSYNFQTR